MRSIAHVSALAISLALSSCATSPPISCPPPATGTAQALMLRTEPPGATCSVSRGGEVVASVEVTPDYAMVPRRNESIEVVCRKGNLVQRMTFAAMEVPASAVNADRRSARECAGGGPSSGEKLAGAAAEVVFQGLISFFPPAAIGLAAVGAVAIATREPSYVYRQPPVFVLAPTTFDSEPACDAHFAALKAGLEAGADAQRARVNETCHPWPCRATDPVCPNPVCADQRARIDTQLMSLLGQIPGLRARVRIVPP